VNERQFAALTAAQKQNIKEIPLMDIDIPEKPAQARAQATAGTTRSSAHIDDLANDIDKHGQAVPITVEPIEDNRYKLVCGNHRYDAKMILKGHHTITAYVRTFLDDTEKDCWQLEENVDDKPRLSATHDDIHKSVRKIIMDNEYFGDPKSLKYDKATVKRICDDLKPRTGVDGRTLSSIVRKVLKSKGQSNSDNDSSLKDYHRAGAWEYIKGRYKDSSGQLAFPSDGRIEDVQNNVSAYIVGKDQDIKNHVANVMFRKIRAGFTGKTVLFVYAHFTYDKNWQKLDEIRRNWLAKIDSINNDRTLLTGPLFDEIYFLPQKDDKDVVGSEDLTKLIPASKIRLQHLKNVA
jgi:hypothetical protein